jgi:hypothetical protein
MLVPVFLRDVKDWLTLTSSSRAMMPATLNQDLLALRRLQPLMPPPGRLRVSIGSCPESPSHSCYANFTSIPVQLQPQIPHWGMNLHASATSWSISRPRRLRPLFCKRARCSRIASPPLASHSFCGSAPSPLFSAACAEHESILPCLGTLPSRRLFGQEDLAA